ncbi:hypothetical protein [Rahnella aquatilis]|uniref:hypothetical protein n=1 Tax=Rahnella aquatilis TaxID=34038 RepID=UPI0012DFF263|nr:hypothetical protein [Rahnella aquatilis]
MKAPRSGKISSLSLCYLKHGQRAIARVEKAKGDPRGKKHFSLLVGFGAARHVTAALKEPKYSRSTPPGE